MVMIAVSVLLSTTNSCSTWRGDSSGDQAYQVILEPGKGQFRESEPRRVHTRINSCGRFLVVHNKLICGKRESVS